MRTSTVGSRALRSADGDDVLVPWHYLVQDTDGLGFAPVVMDADHQPDAHAMIAARFLHGVEHAGHQIHDGNAMLDEALRTDEEFRTDHAILVGPTQVGAGHVVKSRPVWLAALEIKIEE